jgi:methyl-accepting chemotaxis protein
MKGLEAAEKVHALAIEAHAKGELVAEHIAELTAHTQRIDEFITVMREIANKTDLLAVNASVDGTRDGATSMELSLVAKQMRHIAATAVDAVEEIEHLHGEIRQATAASVLAAEEASKRAASTIESARQAVDKLVAMDLP